jgi:hypothetical protein
VAGPAYRPNVLSVPGMPGTLHRHPIYRQPE